MSKVVLIAEDYDDVRDYMVYILRSYGFQVYEATNGRDALQAVTEHHPDLILMDISMPVMDGLEATRIIRSSDASISQTPIIAITAFDASYQQKALAAGCNEVLSKPLDFDDFEAVLRKYLPAD